MRSKLAILKALLAARWRQHHPPRFPQPEPHPILTEPELLERFAEFNALGLSLAEARAFARRELEGAKSPYPGYSFGLSSGTTGEAGVFITHESERRRWIGTILAKYLDWKQLAGAEIALLLKHNNRLYTDVSKTGRVRLHYFDIARPVEDWAPRLAALAPDVLVGPASVLCAVAASKPFSPHTVIAGAEPLFPQDRAALETAFGVAPRGIYQAKEGFLASGCRYGCLHLNEDLIFFEFQSLAADPRRALPVITDFTRTSQTFSRYRIDDVLTLAETPCPCGSGFRCVSQVEGRLLDVPVRRRQDGAHIPFFPFDLNDAIQRPDLYTVSQLDFDTFQLGMPVPSHDSAQSLAQALSIDGAPLPRVTLVPYVPDSPGQKRRRFRRLFDVENRWLNP